MVDEVKKTSTVFLGAAANMQAMITPEIYDEMISDGIGLYGHGNGIYAMVVSNRMAALTASLPASKTAPGVAEFGMSSGYAIGTVRVTDTGSAAEKIAIGTLFRGQNGQEYVVTAFPGQPGYTSQMTGPNSNGYVSTGDDEYYQIAAGKSITLTLESLTADTSANLAANGITSFAISTVSPLNITSSTAFTGGGSFSESYFTGGKSAPMYYLYQQYGYFPSEGNVNVDESHRWTDNDLSSWKDYVDAARGYGVMNMAPIFTNNALTADYSQDFATSSYWATAREAALYGGGLSFDSPPGFFNQFTSTWFKAMGQDSDTYINFVESEIRWATSEGLRSSVIIAPFGTGMTDTIQADYLEQTKAMVARLQKDGAMPSQFIVENYNLDANSNTFDSNASNTESLNSVASYLSTVTTKSTNSERNLQTIAQSGADMMMSGIRPSVSVDTGHSVLYDYPQLFTASPDTLATMTLSLSGGSDLRLFATGGTLSQDGRTLTAMGTATQLSAILKSLGADVQALRDNTATLSLEFKDAASDIKGTTSISYKGYASIGNYTSEIDGSLDMQDTALSIYVTAGEFTLNGSGGTPKLSGAGQATLEGSYSTVVDNLTAGAILRGTANSITVGVGSSLSMVDASSASVILSPNSSLFIANSARATVTVSTGMSSIEMTGGTLYYSASSGLGNTSINQKAGSSTIAMGAGQTSAIINLAAAQATVTGLQDLSDSLVLTGLDSPADLTTTYDNGEAILTAAGLSGRISVKNSLGYGISYSSKNSGNIAVQVSSDSNNGAVYASDEGLHSIIVGNASLTANFSTGYTKLFEDMSANSHVDLNGFNIANGLVLLTGLKRLTDVQVSYEDGNAIVTEAGTPGNMIIHNTDKVSFVSNSGDTNFSQLAGTNALAVLSTPTPAVISVSEGNSETFTAGSGVKTVDMSGGSLSAILNDTSYTILKQDFSGDTASVVDGFTTANGEILATHLANFNDLQVYYGDGNAIVSSEHGSLTLFNTQIGSVSLLQNVGDVNFSTLAGSGTLAVVSTASTGNAITITSERIFNAAPGTDNLVHFKSGNLTANLTAKSYTTLDIDMTSAAKMTLNDFVTTNGLILLKGVHSASDVSISYHDNNAYISGGLGAEVIMTGTNHVSLLSSVGNVDFSHMTGQPTMALIGS
ncbi:hypothetical protein [Gluconobacter wancherniae]|uniref:hypothetical protein n=1 Tax=Gluconobacter wancherniae TaxID=1307955 RepID=UPI001B8B0E49|nr:hypothetical protein [Gluconobacter wancherniae]MBS1089924.1 hypothetical protein [Gluconobacter wancherniae]